LGVVVVFSGLIIWRFSSVQQTHAQEIQPDAAHNAEDVNVTVAVTKVPQYLFAHAKYATPITFRLVDADHNASKFTVNSVAVTLYNGGTAIASVPATTSRFDANEGLVQANGSTDTDTVYIPSSTYSSVSLSPHTTANASFTVTVNERPVGISGSPATTVTSTVGDSPSKVKLFADNTLYALDIGETGSPTIDAAVPMASNVTSEAIKSYQHWQHGNDFTDTAPVPHEDTQSTVSWLGFIDGTTQGITNTSTDIGLTTLLEDDRHASGVQNAGEGVKNRIYGKRLGGVIYCSYGGKDPAGLDPREHAMDLSVTSCSLDINMFPSAQVRVWNSCANPGGVHTAGLASAGLGIISAFVEGPVGIALEVAQAIFDAVDAVDLKSDIDGRAEGTIYRSILHTPVGGATSPTTLTPFDRSDPGDSGYIGAYPCSQAGLNCNVGDQWVALAELESASSAVSTMAEPFGGNAYAQNGTEYKVLNASEFSTFTVQLSK
jgi:hypothetical protein